MLKKAITASRALAELRGIGDQIPNQTILLKSIILQEAKLSSEIENIVTTNDKLYHAYFQNPEHADPHTREVLRYQEAVWEGYLQLQKGELLTSRFFLNIVRSIKKIEFGVRDYPGTAIHNPVTKEIIYTPPEGKQRIETLLHNLSEYIYHDDTTDPLIKMAVFHYQFEAIHPFPDGNGRTGRVLNILYLIEKKLLDIPILYLSKYIIRNKNEYYQKLRGVTEDGDWESWILHMLNYIEESAIEAKTRILAIRNSVQDALTIARQHMKNGYSKELIELVFSQYYVRINTLIEHDIAKRAAASTYLKELESIGILNSQKIGRDTIYLNIPLLEILES